MNLLKATCHNLTFIISYVADICKTAVLNPQCFTLGCNPVLGDPVGCTVVWRQKGCIWRYSFIYLPSIKWVYSTWKDGKETGWVAENGV